MSQAAGLASRILVNHREPGFLRLELPAELCGTNASAALEQGLTLWRCEANQLELATIKQGHHQKLLRHRILVGRLGK